MMTTSDILPIAILTVQVLGLVVALVFLRVAFYLIKLFVIDPKRDPLRHIAGPGGPKMEMQVHKLMDPECTAQAHDNCSRLFGKNFRFQGFGYFDYRLMTLDMRAITHILKSPLYEKPWQTRRVLSNMLGRGIFTMEGEEHKIQRNIVSPAFTPTSVKSLYPVFIQKAEELRLRWEGLLSTPQSSQPLGFALPAPVKEVKTKEGGGIFDAYHWVSRATFDAMGLAAFDYNFHALMEDNEPVYLAYKKLFALQTSDSLNFIMRLFFPILDKIMPDADIRTRNQTQAFIRNFGEHLIHRKRERMATEKVDLNALRDKDLLSVLMRANLSEDPSKRLSDQEILDQISTFLFAGSDSTSIAISWALHFLGENPDIQARLREELKHIASRSPSPSRSSRSSSATEDWDINTPPPPSPSFTPVHTEFGLGAEYSCEDYVSEDAFDCPDVEALDALPLLDGVVRETIRLSPPVHSTIRVATQDDVIPTSDPVQLADGTLSSENGVHIKAGSYVHIPIEALNLSTDIWGPSARSFDPDRWSALPPSARNQPGLANVMTFIFGAHACPGHRFALLEMKAFLAVLVRDFEFTSVTKLGRQNSIATRPYVKDCYSKGHMLPLRIRRLELEEM